MGLIIAALRWIAGCEPAARKSTTDDLEPYCDVPTLKARITAPLQPGESRAIHKIGARYGAEL